MRPDATRASSRERSRGRGRCRSGRGPACPSTCSPSCGGRSGIVAGVHETVVEREGPVRSMVRFSTLPRRASRPSTSPRIESSRASDSALSLSRTSWRRRARLSSATTRSVVRADGCRRGRASEPRGSARKTRVWRRSPWTARMASSRGWPTSSTRHRAQQLLGLTAGDVGGEDPETVRETSGTSSSATIFRRMDLPRKRMASPSSAPVRGGRCSVIKRREPTTDLPPTRRRVRVISGRASLSYRPVVLVLPVKKLAKATEESRPDALHPHKAVGWNSSLRDLCGLIGVLGGNLRVPAFVQMYGGEDLAGVCATGERLRRVERARAGQPPLSRPAVGS